MAETSPATGTVRDRASPDYLSVLLGNTAGEALGRVRAAPRRCDIPFCYVLDEDGCLCGVLPLHKLLRTPAEARVADIMQSKVISIPEAAPLEALGDFFVTYRLPAFPVVDRAGRLVGVALVESFADLVFDTFDQRLREELLRVFGLASASGQQRLRVRRAERLAATLAGAALGMAAMLMASLLRAAWESAPTLPLFLPMVAGLGALSSLHASARVHAGAGMAEGADGGSVVHSELEAAGIAGLAAAVFCAVLAYLGLGQGLLALVLGAGLLAGIPLAALAGGGLSLAWHWLAPESRGLATPVSLVLGALVGSLCYLTVGATIL